VGDRHALFTRDGGEKESIYMYVCVYIYMYIYVCMCVYIYYIHTTRERGARSIRRGVEVGGRNAILPRDGGKKESIYMYVCVYIYIEVYTYT